MSGLVLSLFPGIGLLDRAFEEEGFCVVRGPDLLWGGDVRTFHPPAGRFDGVIGGPPCQAFSMLRTLQAAQGYEPRHGNLIPEFERVVVEAQPAWFVMENVPQAPEPVVPGWHVRSVTFRDCWVGGETLRKRRFSFGSNLGLIAGRAARSLQGEMVALHTPEPKGAVTSSDGGKGVRMARYTLPEMLRLSGLPEDFFGDDSPLTMDGKRKMIGNGVPLLMGRAVARAVKRALEEPHRIAV